MSQNKSSFAAVIPVSDDVIAYVSHYHYGYSGAPAVEFVSKSTMDSPLTIVLDADGKTFEIYTGGTTDPVVYNTNCVKLLPAVMPLYLVIDEATANQIYKAFIDAIEDCYPTILKELGNRL